MNTKTKLAELLMRGRTPYEEGVVNGLVFALTKTDVAFRFWPPSVKTVCDLLGWGYKPLDDTGWEIDWDKEVDEEYLKSVGCVIV